MAHDLVTSADIPVDGEKLEADKLSRIKTICLGLAVVGGVFSMLFLLGVFGRSAQGSYSFSWLYAVFFFTTLALGGCFWTLLHNVTNSGWGVSVRRVMENVGYVFPWMLIPVLPILLLPDVQEFLYEWMEKHRMAKEAAGSVKEGLHHGETADHLLYSKYWYLNLNFWYLRVIAYFAVLGFVIHFLRKLSIDQDTDAEPGTSRLLRARFHSCWGVPVFAVVLTFLAIDLVKGLDYKWFSTMWRPRLVYVIHPLPLGPMTGGAYDIGQFSFLHHGRIYHYIVGNHRKTLWNNHSQTAGGLRFLGSRTGQHELRFLHCCRCRLKKSRAHPGETLLRRFQRTGMGLVRLPLDLGPAFLVDPVEAVLNRPVEPDSQHQTTQAKRRKQHQAQPEVGEPLQGIVVHRVHQLCTLADSRMRGSRCG